MGKRLVATFKILPDGRWYKITGRDAWALIQLQIAGQRGVTPIETIHETHGGPFSGTHARYVLRADILIESEAHGKAA